MRPHQVGLIALAVTMIGVMATIVGILGIVFQSQYEIGSWPDLCAWIGGFTALAGGIVNHQCSKLQQRQLRRDLLKY